MTARFQISWRNLPRIAAYAFAAGLATGAIAAALGIALGHAP
jgi:hypothetical protein